MAETPEQQKPPDTGADNQAEIDALLNAAEGGGEPSEVAPEPQTSAGEPRADRGEGLSQSDIDAALNAIGRDPGAEAPGAAADGALDQSDIDAAIAAASAAAGDAPAEMTDGGDSPADDARVDSEGRPFDAAAAAMAAAIDEEKSAAGGEPDIDADRVELPDFGSDGYEGDGTPQSIDLLSDVDLRVRIELGRTRMYVEDVLRLGEGSVVELDKLAGDPVDVFVNDRLVARGEVLVLNDNFCVRVSEIIADENQRAMA